MVDKKKLEDILNNDINRKRQEILLEWLSSTDCAKTLALSTSIIVAGMFSGEFITGKDEKEILGNLQSAMSFAQNLANELVANAGKAVIVETVE